MALLVYEHISIAAAYNELQADAKMPVSAHLSQVWCQQLAVSRLLVGHKGVLLQLLSSGSRSRGLQQQQKPCSSTSSQLMVMTACS